MVKASKETRLVNYLIDKGCFIVVLIIHAVIFDSWLHLIPDEGSPLLAVYFAVLYFGFHFLFEFLFLKTPGKFITKTVVANQSGERPRTKALIIRNLSRLIPLDNLSFLLSTEGWHDRISGTQVISPNS